MAPNKNKESDRKFLKEVICLVQNRKQKGTVKVLQNALNKC